MYRRVWTFKNFCISSWRYCNENWFNVKFDFEKCSRTTFPRSRRSPKSKFSKLSNTVDRTAILVRFGIYSIDTKISFPVWKKKFKRFQTVTPRVRSNVHGVRSSRWYIIVLRFNVGTADRLLRLKIRFERKGTHDYSHLRSSDRTRKEHEESVENRTDNECICESFFTELAFGIDGGVRW